MSVFVADISRSNVFPYYNNELLSKVTIFQGNVWTMEDFIMEERNTDVFKYSSPKHRRHGEFILKYNAFKVDQNKIEYVKSLYGGNIEFDLEKDYIGEPTLTQFQEAHKKWRRITEQLKEQVDKLRMSNQEKDIEIQQLRDQVTQQAAKWLVPNFK